MIKAKAHLWVCSQFAPEARAAVAGEPDLATVRIHTFPACCHCPAMHPEEVGTRIAGIPREEPIAWVGGLCLAALCGKLPVERPVTVHRLNQCFHLVADRDQVDARIREGAYLCTPGWVAHWREQMNRLGFTTPELARDLFGESVQRVVLLDTGQDARAPGQVADFAAYVDRPVETIAVGLDYLRLQLALLVARLGIEAERREDAAALGEVRRQSAEAAMAMDLLGRLSTAPSEPEAIAQMLDIFTTLFAPQTLFYLSVETGRLHEPVGAESPTDERRAEKARRFAATSAAYRENAAKAGFLLRARCGASTLGVFGMEGFASPQYYRHYLNLALHMMSLCGMAIKWARTGGQLRESEERYRTLFSAMQEGFALHEMICDAAGQPIDYRFFDVNPAFERLTGLKREKLIGRPASEVLPGTEPSWIQRYGEVASTGIAQRFEEYSGTFGKHFDVYAYSPRQGWFAVIVSDMTPRKQAEERIRYLAHHDPLTDLPNRTLLAERTEMALALAARRRTSTALLFCDLDHFKDINDSLGHAAGDALLTQMAARFKAALRGMDTVARLGGDEFVMLLPEVTRDQAAHLAEKLLATLRKPLNLDGHCLTVTGSIGISLYPHDGTDFAMLLRNADVAMYRAKQSGRHRFCFYDTRMNAEILERLTLLAELENAVRSGQLRTYFQPKVSLVDGALLGAEALVRWQHPEKGLLPPGRFIPIAENTELIIAIGEWVLEDVCRHLTAWRAAGQPVPVVAVNLAARHFRELQLAGWLEALLDRYDLSPGALELELTESTLLDAGTATATIIEALRCRGFQLAIDDFGTGYSNLAYLKNLPVVELKIDRSFVSDLETDPTDRAIAAAVVALSHNLGLKVVAEGVETEGQRMILLEQGCDCAQGYLFSPPLPAEEFIIWRWNGR